MLKEKKPTEIIEQLSTEGQYGEANLDKDEVEKVLSLIIKDYEFGKILRKLDKPNWRVIFNIHYDVLREFCDLLMRFKKQKISNHQGLFAFIIVHFKELDLDWKFFEMIRIIRNNNKYKGINIIYDNWKNVEFQMDLYIKTIEKEIKKKLKEL